MKTKYALNHYPKSLILNRIFNSTIQFLGYLQYPHIYGNPYMGESAGKIEIIWRDFKWYSIYCSVLVLFKSKILHKFYANFIEIIRSDHGAIQKILENNMQ